MSRNQVSDRHSITTQFDAKKQKTDETKAAPKQSGVAQVIIDVENDDSDSKEKEVLGKKRKSKV